MRVIRTVAFVAISVALYMAPAGAAPELSPLEDSYRIELVKTVDPGEKVWELNGKRVFGESYRVRRGEHVYQILRDRGFADLSRIPEVLDLLKRLNPSLSDLDLIHPGQKILVPLCIEPIETTPGAALRPVGVTSKPTPGVEALPDHSDIEATLYTVRRGDTLVKIIKNHNDIPPNVLYGPYMNMLKKLNPALEDINAIESGQVIRLPIYPPRMVRKPIVRPEAEPGPEAVPEAGGAGREDRRRVWTDMKKILTEMGEKCIQSGTHFIPLVSGGQIDLKAEAFPLVVLHHGVNVVVDLHGMLPARIRKLIETGWDKYKVVDLSRVHTLNGAIGKMLDAGGYPEVRPAVEPLQVEADFPLVVRGDWIVTMSPTPRTAVINLAADTATPSGVKDYLRDRGVLLVELPAPEKMNQPIEAAVRTAADPQSLVAEVLDMAGFPYAGGVQIPAYQSSTADLRLMIDADFFLQVHGRDAVIDLRGLPPEVVSFLDDHRFMVLPLSGVNGGMEIVERVLRFLGVPSGRFPEHCPAGLGVGGNVEVLLRGACFDGREAGTVLVTSSPLPAQLEPLFARRDVRVLSIAF